MNIKKVFCALTCAVLTAGLVFSPVSRSSGLGETVYAGTQSVPLTMDEVPSYDNYGKSADEAALAELYDEHMGMTNAEALSVLSEKPADLSAAKSVDEEAALLEALKAYEAKKALYLLGKAPAGAPDEETGHAWERQKALNEFYYGNGSSEVVFLIPSVSISKLSVKEDHYELAVDEWMTLGYCDRSISDVVNTSAYLLDYTMKYSPKDGVVFAVENGKELFAEMDEAAEAPVSANGPVPVTHGASSGKDALVPTGDIPSYNINGALAYADQWALSRNPAYSDYTGRGGDCANFVSQCLCAGGLPTDGTWYKDSKAWIAVIALSNYLCDRYGLPRLSADNSNIQVGSPVCYQWHSNWQAGYRLNHVTLCVGRNAQGVPIVSGHTRDIKGVAWNYGYSNTTYMTIPLGGGFNSLPKGYLDTAAGGPGEVTVTGWAYDPDHIDQPVRVRIYMDALPEQGGTFLKEFKAKKNRQDLVSAGYTCGPDHGFEKTLPLDVTGNHTFYAVATDLDSGEAVLSNSPLDAKIRAPYAVKIPAVKCRAGESTIIKVVYRGQNVDSVDWTLKDDTLAVIEEDSRGSKGTKEWVKLKITGKKQGSTKLIFRLLDEDEELLFKGKQTIRIKAPLFPLPPEPEPEEPSTEEPSTEQPSTETAEPSTETSTEPSAEASTEPSTEQPSTEPAAVK